MKYYLEKDGERYPDVATRSRGTEVAVGKLRKRAAALNYLLVSEECVNHNR